MVHLQEESLFSFVSFLVVTCNPENVEENVVKTSLKRR